MHDNKDDLLNEVARYYSEKLSEFGETPRGVDWNGIESQTLRFEQLSRIVAGTQAFSLNDLGCGYGALFDFLIARLPLIDYLGLDISADMIDAARRRHGEHPQTRYLASCEPDRVADYGLASGVFNVRLNRSDDEWFDILQSALDTLDRTSRLGFAFNCLTSYCDEHKKRAYLFYADPCRLFDLCKRKYSRDVALLHDYGLYEFTILVRKSP